MARRPYEGEVMQNKTSNSRALRQLAEELLIKIAEHEDLLDADREDLATSLVRQWITYDGTATFFLREQQIYFGLARSPLGRFFVAPQPDLPGWMNRLREDWKISPDDLPDVMRQLNMGQSAEVTNTDGIPLRLWVNPKERSKGVEPLVKEPVPPGRKRDYRKIAGHQLERQFGTTLTADEMESLACSVAKQWQQYQGHACLFLNGEQQLHFILTEEENGGCNVVTERRSINLESSLSSLGVPPEVAPDLIVPLNLGQEVEFRGKSGSPSVLWHDPRTEQFLIREINPIPPARGD
jgi:hypothetical protein